MQRHTVRYRTTGRFAPIVVDHVEGAAELKEFQRFTPDRPGLQEALRARNFDPAQRVVLVNVVRDQYADLHVDPAVQANIDALALDGTRTVTTGHQLCLFLGPLYVPFKILNIIRLAKELCTEDRKVVPVFWMATEDHDRDEIDHTWIGDRKVQWPGKPGGAVGRLNLAGIGSVLQEAESAIGIGPFAAELRALLRECYREEFTLAQATRRFVNALFGRFGLVIIDADDPRLKRAFSPIIQEELLNHVTERTVRYANGKLMPRYKPQAHARAINLFHLSPGQRSRIEEVDHGFRTQDGGPVRTVDEVLVELQVHPERFSPNVLMRPLYQEVILPNIAYVGGGGELAYWLQLPWLFLSMQVPMPVLMLRTSALFITESQARKWRACGLSWADLFASGDLLEKRIALEHADFPVSLVREREAHKALFDGLADRARAIDPTLEASVRAKEAFSARGLDKLENRFLRAAKHRQGDRIRRMHEVQEALFAHGLQERRLNFMGWYALEGPSLFDRWSALLDPLDARFSVIEE